MLAEISTVLAENSAVLVDFCSDCSRFCSKMSVLAGELLHLSGCEVGDADNNRKMSNFYDYKNAREERQGHSVLKDGESR